MVTGDGPTIRGRWLPMSFTEFMEWSGEAYAEWVDGRGIAYRARTDRHQSLLGWLLVLIGSYVDLHDLGSVYPLRMSMLLLNGRSLRQPDLFFITREHRDKMTTYWLDGPADLVVEIIAGDSVTCDRVEKFAEYAAAGVREYWLIDSRRVAEPPACYQLAESGEYTAIAPAADGCYYSGVLPGFWLDPAWLQQDPLPKPSVIIQAIAPQALRAALGGAGS
jgi:Uma2 family endonuclease